jgi:DNA-directed RNA polymerase specialized sigma24 family protein
VQHRIIDHERSDRSREAREEEWETERFEESLRDIHESHEDDVAAVLRERELFEVAGFELNEMSKKARNVFLLHKMDKLSVEDTAAKMGMKVDAVKKSLVRTGQQLKAALAAYRRPRP